MADASDGSDATPPQAETTNVEVPSLETLSSRLSRSQWTTVAAAMGIGSAAIVAGLLYTNRKKPETRKPPREFMD